MARKKIKEQKRKGTVNRVLSRSRSRVEEVEVEEK